MTDILITGGSDGIGLAAAKLLAAEGARMTLVARDAARLREAIAKLPGEDHDFIAADLSVAKDLEMLAKLPTTKRYDIFINNAGAGLYGRFTELPLEEQLRMMRLNMESVVVLSRAYLSQAKRGDALVNTASFLAYAPLPGAAVYSATKAFVATLSETLWWECRQKGVYVLGFSPGVIATQFHASAGGSVGRFPHLLVQSPDAAARELVAALQKRTEPRVITGFATRAMVRLQRLVSRKMALSMMGTSSPIAPSP